MRCGGVGGGQTGVEVDTVHVEVTPRTVHQASTGVGDLQHGSCQVQRDEITSPLYSNYSVLYILFQAT